MAKMKTTTTDNPGRDATSADTQTQDTVENAEAGDMDTTARRYEKKGKKRATPHQGQSTSEKGGKDSGATAAEGGSLKKRRQQKPGASQPPVSSSPRKKKGGPPAGKKKTATTSASADDYSESAEASGESSDDGSDHHDDLVAPAKKKKPTSEFTEEECRRQLHLLSQPSKRPPTAMSEDIFATVCQLGRDGVNPHRLRMGKDVSKKDVEALFGVEKRRNGFLVSEKLTPALRKEVESLYCQCYQKPHPSKHVGKELAMGWTLETKGVKINWAGFAAETNLGQRRHYARRARMYLRQLATVLRKRFSEVAAKEGFTKYLDVPDGKQPLVPLFNPVHDNSSAAAEERSSVLPTPPSIQAASTTSARKLGVQVLVASLSAKVDSLREKATDIENKAEAAADQHRGRLLGIQQLRETMKEMEEESGAEVLQRVLDGHLKKLKEFSDSETQLRRSLQDMKEDIQRGVDRLAALQEHLSDLSRGGQGFVMHPHPQVNDEGDGSTGRQSTVTLHTQRCSLCLDAFPFGDLVFCSCQHVYHPWCAAQWFTSRQECVVSGCGPVNPQWSRSWGFPNALESPGGPLSDTQGVVTALVCTGNANQPHLQSLSVFGSIGIGAPSVSASDSTVSKVIPEDQVHRPSAPLQVPEGVHNVNPLAQLPNPDDISPAAPSNVCTKAAGLQHSSSSGTPASASAAAAEDPPSSTKSSAHLTASGLPGVHEKIVDLPREDDAAQKMQITEVDVLLQELDGRKLDFLDSDIQHMDEDPWDLEAAARAPPIRGKVSDTSGILSREVVAGALEGPVTNSTAVATAGIPAAKDVHSGKGGSRGGTKNTNSTVPCSRQLRPRPGAPTTAVGTAQNAAGTKTQVEVGKK